MIIHYAGDLVFLPDSPGVYFIICTYMGETDFRLGDVLYIGVSNSLRRRLAYAMGPSEKSAPHGAQAPLMKYQESGGVAGVMYYLLGSNSNSDTDDALEHALLAEFMQRSGHLPPWNRKGPSPNRSAPLATSDLAKEILDRLNVIRART